MEVSRYHPPGRPEVEQTPAMIEAFEYFFSLRTERSLPISLQRIAEKFNIKYGTARSWYYRFNWREKTARRLNDILQTDETIRKAIVDDIIEFRQGMRAGLDPWFKRVRKGEVKIENWKEAIDCINAYARLITVGNTPENGNVRVLNIITNVPRPKPDDRLILDVHSDEKTE